VFTVEERERVREHVIAMARHDPRIVAGAELGSAVAGLADRWSDLDLTFAVADGVPIDSVLDDWAARLATDVGAVQLFDLVSVATTYRVFLLPSNLQVDVSVTPGAIAQMGPKFRLLFGDAVNEVRSPPLVAQEVFGLAVHHALRTRVCIERARWFAALYSLGELRNETLSLACLGRGLAAKYARAVDELPDTLLSVATRSVARSLERDELLRALGHGIDLLLTVAAERDDLPDMTANLHMLTQPDLR